jgi:hypothetical protein
MIISLRFAGCSGGLFLKLNERKRVSWVQSHKQMFSKTLTSLSVSNYLANSIGTMFQRI